MVLTVEVEPSEKYDSSVLHIDEVDIFFDEEGLELLEYKLRLLRQGKGPDHEHLMTPSWAGNELTEEKQGESRSILVNHLRIVRLY